MTLEGVALLRLAVRELEAGAALAESVVLSSEGSVARPAGARMLTRVDGTCEGTVGGGTPELRCQRIAASVASSEVSDACQVTLDHASTGMVCGGSQLVGIRRLGARDLEVYREALAALDEGREVGLVVDWADAAHPVTSLDGDAPQPGAVPRYEGPRYVEPLRLPERAIVFGGGHVGQALVPALAALGFEVTLFDDRPEVAAPERFGAAARVICGDYTHIGDLVRIGPKDCVCVMTHGHRFDIELVAQALCEHPRYLGCMGSRRKREALLEALGAQGFSSAEAESVELPIGLDIGAVTPSEIAVSIAARLVEVRNVDRA